MGWISAVQPSRLIKLHSYNIGDKSISAGENSLVAVTNSSIYNTSIGIASKDLSKVTAENLEITNAQVAGLAAYTKKPQYGPGNLIGKDIKLVNTGIGGLCQIGSSLILDGYPITCEDLDVEALYEQGILGN